MNQGTNTPFVMIQMIDFITSTSGKIRRKVRTLSQTRHGSKSNSRPKHGGVFYVSKRCFSVNFDFLS